MRTVGYLRVSTIDQDLEKNKSEILFFANEKKLGNVEWIEEKVSGRVCWKERKLAQVVHELQPGDNLCVAELSRLGRSMLEVMEILSVLSQKQVHVYAIKGKWELDGSLQSKILAMVFSLASEIEAEFISLRTKEALAARKRSGLPLGRPKGPGKSKLDPHRIEIEALLKNGSTQTFIAKRYNTTPANLCNWLKKNDLRKSSHKRGEEL